MRRNIQRWSTWALLGLMVLLPLAAKVSPIANAPKWDEFIYAYDAQRILDGQIPYRDFFQFTPPAHFLLLAGWFKLFGASSPLTVGRYLALLQVLVAWGLAWRALRRAGWPCPWDMVASALIPAACFPFWAIPSHHWLAFLVFASSFEAYDFKNGHVRGLKGCVFLGFLGGVALLTLQSVFFEVFALWGAIFLLLGRGLWRRFLAAAGGFAAGAGPILLWLTCYGSLLDFWRDVFVWTARHYRMEGSINAVPLLGDLPDRLASLWSGAGAAHWFVQALPGTLTYCGLAAAAILLVGIFCAAVFRSAKARRFSSPFTAGVMALTAVQIALYLRGKTDWLHMVYVLPRMGLPWLILLGLQPTPRLAAPKAWKLGVAVLLTAAASFHAAPLLARWPSTWEYLDVDRTTREAPVNVWLRAQPWLEARDTVAAFPEGGEVYLYVRPAAVGFTLLLSPHEGYQSEDQYALAASQILKNRARCVILTREQEEEYLAQGELARVVRGKYNRYAVLGDAVLYRLRAPG